MNPEQLKTAVNDIYPWLVSLRRDFHQHPEPAMKEFRTRDRICALLDELDIPYRTAGTGIIADLTTSPAIPGAAKTIALRADMDGLPMEDRKDVPYRSAIPGMMHACGHDAHMTVLLSAARILKQFQNQLETNVRFLFQPAEETGQGAKAMIEARALENPKPDAIFALHVNPRIPTGAIGIQQGPYSAAADAVNIRIHGQSCHGARPFEGLDAIVIAAQVITAAQTIISRSIDTRDQAVLSFGTIQGGDKRNIIADQVTIKGTLRTLSKTTRQKIIRHLDRIVTTVPQSFGGKGILEILPGPPMLTNTPAMANHVKRNAERLFGKEAVIIEDTPSMGFEDFAYYLEKTPGAIFSLGTQGPDNNTRHPVHTHHFDLDETALKTGTTLLADSVCELSSY